MRLFKIRNRWFTNEELKIWAIVTMFIDHAGAALLENTALYHVEGLRMIAVVCRLIGRISFPLFCFLLVEGILHTRNIKRYGLRLFTMAVISEVPFDLAFFGHYGFERQNVFFTLFLGLLMIQGMKYLESLKEKAGLGRILLYIGNVVLILISAACSVLFVTDYSYMGILLISVLYLLRNKKKARCITGGILFSYELTAVLSFYMMYHYTGEKGDEKLPREAFYLFYPVHLLLLWGIRCAAGL